MVKKSLDAKVRPLSAISLEKASLLGAARIYVSKDSLISLTGGLDNGNAAFVERLDGEEPLRREAALWVLPDKNLSPNVVMMTRAFQEATGFKIGDSVRISLAGSTPDAEEIVAVDVAEGEKEDWSGHKHPFCWENSLGISLDRAELIFPGMVLEGVSINKFRRTFQIISINSQSNNLARFKTASTTIRILQPGEDQINPDPEGEPGGDLIVTGVPGLNAQIKSINAFLEAFGRPFWTPSECTSCGMVIHGGSGTGKTFILECIAETKWGRVTWIKPSDKLATIREVFKQAQTQQPSIILIDAIHELIAKDRSNRDAVIECLADELDALSAQAVAQNALPNVLVVATCLDYMTDVPAKLQKLTRLNDNFALPIPRAAERLEILKFFNPPLRLEDREESLKSLSKKTHAYSGGDLAQLVASARKIMGRRLKASGEVWVEGKEYFTTAEDMENALRVTRPTAMHDINLQPPTIHWQDVGGQESLKKVLTRMIKMAQDTNPQTLKVIRHPPKGLLLYGPPGCSKTLSAQAMATESSFNFFAVKGAELLNMYVGESERAVRTLFERARAASPSIIFFDEIDSISGQRTGPGQMKSGGVNMLTTLLTEMDGFESLTGVLVLAATNRPESIDPALLRPGRFDRCVYVGPPDLAAREAVFRVHLRGLSVSSDVDITALAEKAEGHSGAEIQAICDEAGMVVMERFDEDGSGEEKLEIKMADLVGALDRTPRNITRGMIEGYEKWSRQFKKA